MEFSVMLVLGKLPHLLLWTYGPKAFPRRASRCRISDLKRKRAQNLHTFSSRVWNCCEEIYGGFEGKGKKKKVCSDMHLHALLDVVLHIAEMPFMSQG